MWRFIQGLPLFRYLNVSANNIDRKRIKEIGVNAACSEWLLRNGSSFKIQNSETIFQDYNKLPPVKANIKITEIHSLNSSLMDHGFKHLDGLDMVKKIVISSNSFITDQTIRNLLTIKKSLEELILLDCPKISDSGIKLLINFKELKYLELSHLLNVENKDQCLELLKENLPNCIIKWND